MTLALNSSAGCKVGKYSSEGGKIQQDFAANQGENEANGCLIAVDFSG